MAKTAVHSGGRNEGSAARQSRIARRSGEQAATTCSRSRRQLRPSNARASNERSRAARARHEGGESSRRPFFRVLHRAAFTERPPRSATSLRHLLGRPLRQHLRSGRRHHESERRGQEIWPPSTTLAPSPRRSQPAPAGRRSFGITVARHHSVRARRFRKGQLWELHSLRSGRSWIRTTDLRLIRAAL